MQILWDKKYSVGVKELDEQHKVLIKLINELDTIQTSPKTPQYEKQINEVMKEIKNYTMLHFATEEVLMRMFDYSFLDVHKFSHDKFLHIISEHHKYIRDLIKKQKRIKENTLQAEENMQEIDVRITKVVQFLQKWLLNHIMKDDKQYSHFFSKIQKRAREPGGWLSFLKG